jgi:hypothetical protein
MKLFQNLFKTNKTTPNFLRRVNAKSYVVSNCILGDWNDPSVMLEDKSLIFDVISSNEDSKNKLAIYNKLYYDKIHRFYTLSYMQLAAISNIVPVDPEDHRSVYDRWPKLLDEETYEKLYSKLKLDFVSETPIIKERTPKHIISINTNFWLNTTDPSLGEITLNTYEKRYIAEEFIHSDFNTAINYAAIITNRLTHGSEIAEEFFSDTIIRELKVAYGKNTTSRKIEKLIKEIEQQRFTYFEFKSYSYGVAHDSPYLSYSDGLARVNNEYARVLAQNKVEVDKLIEACALIDNPPFFINHITANR